MPPSSFPTPIQDIAINLAFTVVGEQRINRTLEEYTAIALKLPPLKVLTYRVNQELNLMHRRAICSGVPLPQLCRFKAGDERIEYEDYPRELSYETVRAALTIAGLRTTRSRKR